MGRPRGFAEWSPKPETLELIGQVQQVLATYKDHLPLTIRQVFYALVGNYGYDKTEKAYTRLCEHLLRARRAALIPFSSIRDDGTSGGAPTTWNDPEHFWRAVSHTAKTYNRDRMEIQDVAIELWCEASGMVPQLKRVATPYSIPVYSASGFSSVTVTREIAARALDVGKPMVLLHVGDFNPSGQSIYDAIGEDAAAFVEDGSRSIDLARRIGSKRTAADAELRPVRVALTLEQVEEHGLPTAPAKASDTRSRNWHEETCQAEAMPPTLLASTVEQAIQGYIDWDRYRDMINVEQSDREDIRALLSQAIDLDDWDDDEDEG